MKIKKLEENDQIAIVSLSNGILGEPFVKHELELGKKRLKEFHLIPKFMKNSLLGIDALKNDPELRADDLKQAFEDQNIKAVLSAIGGSDAYKLLPYILGDPEFQSIVKRNPKIFMGYSDTTTIHLALNKIGLNTFYGPAFITDFAEFEKDMLPYTKNAINYLFSAPSLYLIKPSTTWYKERTDFSPAAVGTPREAFEETRNYELILGDKSVTGQLWGGCLDIISTLVNAQFFPKEYDEKENSYAKDCVEILKQYPLLPSAYELSNKILFLETSDAKPTPTKFRKMIKSLKKVGYFAQVNGVIFGKPMDEAYYDEYKNILTEELNEYNIPVVINFNFGHSFPRMILPYGAPLTINVEMSTIVLNNISLY